MDWENNIKHHQIRPGQINNSHPDNSHQELFPARKFPHKAVMKISFPKVQLELLGVITKKKTLHSKTFMDSL